MPLSNNNKNTLKQFDNIEWLIPFIFSLDSNANELAHSSRELFIVFGPLQDIINLDLLYLKIEKDWVS